MSNLSWLNPTPHAIAVYASRPLSPVAPQHSLPSGRYSLLGPDFHRLDRTSLRLAHSLDDFIGAYQHCWRNFDTDELGGFQVNRHLVFGRSLYGKFGGLFALENSVDMASRLIKQGPVCTENLIQVD